MIHYSFLFVPASSDTVSRLLLAKIQYSFSGLRSPPTCRLLTSLCAFSTLRFLRKLHLTSQINSIHRCIRYPFFYTPIYFAVFLHAARIESETSDQFSKRSTKLRIHRVLIFFSFPSPLTCRRQI